VRPASRRSYRSKTIEVRQMSRNVVVASGIAALAMLAGAGQAVAHHSFAAEFDINQPIQLSGEVVRMERPHP